MPLRSPGDLAGFPPRRSSSRLRAPYRIAWHRDRTGAVTTSPWRFASLPGPAPGRFDLPAPQGTCYWSDRRYGAWLEVFRNALVVDSTDASRRRIWSGHGPATHLADLLATRAYRYGVTAAVSTQPDYDMPQQWAAALARAGFDGLVGTCSHDTTSTALNLALFGPAGLRSAFTGWSAAPGPVETDGVLLRELAVYGVRLAPVPYAVPTVPPPT